MELFSFLSTGLALVCLSIIGLAALGYVSLVSLRVILRAFNTWKHFGAYVAWKLQMAQKPEANLRAYEARAALIDIVDITHLKFDDQRMRTGTAFRLGAIRARAQEVLGDIS